MNATSTTALTSPRWLAAAALAAPAALIVWAYWTTLGTLAESWANSAQNSHGYLVPAFAGLLLWLRRDSLKGLEARPTRLGAALVLLGIAMRLFGTYSYYLWLDQ